MLTTLVSLILTFAVIVGFILWLVLTYVPMPEPMKKAIVVLIVIVLVMWLLQFFGLDVPLRLRS